MKAAVLGSPISHSLSPVLHQAGYAALGLSDWSYTRFELQAAELSGFLAELDDQWRGLSLTMPLKQACLEVALEVSPLAVRAQAGNTLVRTAAGWVADNTDIPGLVAALGPAIRSGSTAAVLGAGATARSALLALAQLGFDQVDVFARNPAKAADLPAWARPELTAVVRPLEELSRSGHQIVLSTLPGGAADDLRLPQGAGGLLFDAVYAGWPTPLARQAAGSGWSVIGGLELLVHQAALQFERFTSRPAPLAEMFAAGRAALGQP